MNLPYDVARCFGTDAPLCRTCRRTEPGRGVWQVYTIARIDRSARTCPNHIAKEAAPCENATLPRAG